MMRSPKGRLTRTKMKIYVFSDFYELVPSGVIFFSVISTDTLAKFEGLIAYTSFLTSSEASVWFVHSGLL